MLKWEKYRMLKDFIRKIGPEMHRTLEDHVINCDIINDHLTPFCSLPLSLHLPLWSNLKTQNAISNVMLWRYLRNWTHIHHSVIITYDHYNKHREHGMNEWKCAIRCFQKYFIRIFNIDSRLFVKLIDLLSVDIYRSDFHLFYIVPHSNRPIQRFPHGQIHLDTEE